MTVAAPDGMTSRALWLTSLFFFAPSALAEADAIVTTDLLRIRTVTSIDVAADGSKAVFGVRSIAAAGETEDRPDQPAYAYRTHLYLLDLFAPDAAARQLTFGDRSDSQPTLSPDGRRIAFVRGESEGDGGRQVWIMPTDGGEARQVTKLKLGARIAQWSPGGGLLLVSSAVQIDDLDGSPPYPSERPGREWADAAPDVVGSPDGTKAQIRAWLAANRTALTATVITRMDFQKEQALRGLDTFEHLWLVDPDDPQSPPHRITTGFFDHGNAVFMPDGKSIVYASKKTTDQHPDRVLGTDLWRVGVDGGDDRLLLAVKGWSLSDPRPGFDGSVVAFIGQMLDEPAFRQRRLGVGAVEGDGLSEPLWLTAQETLDASVRGFEWHSARSALVFTTAFHGAFPLSMINPGLIEPAPLIEHLEGLPVGVNAFGVGGGAIVAAVTSPANPCVLAVRDGRGVRVAYDLNPWVAGKDLSMPVEGWVSRPDGTRVQYWLMEPTGRRPNANYPLVVQIHGGPSAMWGPGELTMWHEFQLMASWGFGVVYANPRGSGGYGYAFQRANFQDWGEGPAGDVLAVADHVVQFNDWIDEDRLVVTGGSYAGYLTAWIIGHDHRFKAAVAQRGVYDLATFFGEGNAWRLVQFAMGGHPFDARYRALIDRNSPITYVNRINTPLLIIHASRDLRAGVSQSEMLYRALKVRKRPVEYVRYPEAGHDLSRTGDPVKRMDRLNRIIEFFERHIENPRPAPQAADDPS